MPVFASVDILAASFYVPASRQLEVFLRGVCAAMDVGAAGDLVRDF